ncbi:MAG: ATP-dependent zinc protease [Bacteriovorax sp.]|nr:ATP-dependent zinc protease [Bacteriovorax sp.]
MKEVKSELEFVGWREIVSLPMFKLLDLKAKIDTGAKTSALHADEIEFITFKGKKYVRFSIETDEGKKKYIKSRFLEEREIKSSTGQKTIRPVVKTKIRMGKSEFEIEITLINRDLMGFKMLIGREALNGRFLINPARSYLLKK